MSLKSPAEIEIMAVGGQMAGQVLVEALAKIGVGRATLGIDRFIEKRIRELGATPSFKGFQGYDFSSCININDGIVHGIPNEYRIREGDLVSIDLGVFYQGFHTDVSWTVLVGDGEQFPEKGKFLEAGRRALRASIDECQVGKRIGDVSAAMQKIIEAQGFQVVRDLVGHGVGQRLHEPPQVPCFGKRGSGPELKAGMTLAVEVIYTQGAYKLKVLEDGWTMATADGRLSGLFETTVAVTADRPRILAPAVGF